MRTDLPIPASALAIAAHADDVEFECGATLAKWAAGEKVDLTYGWSRADDETGRCLEG